MHSVKLLFKVTGSLECFVIVKCTKFGKLILRKIIKIVATQCQILRLKCTKLFVSWDSAPDPAYIVHILYTYIFCVIGPYPLLQNRSSAHGRQSCIITFDRKNTLRNKFKQIVGKFRPVYLLTYLLTELDL